MNTKRSKDRSDSTDFDNRCETSDPFHELLPMDLFPRTRSRAKEEYTPRHHDPMEGSAPWLPFGNSGRGTVCGHGRVGLVSASC